MINNTVSQYPGRVAVAAPYQHGIALIGRQHARLDLGMQPGFFRQQKTRAHSDTLGPERQCCDQPAAIRETTAGDHRQLETSGSNGQQHQRGHIVFSRMARAFESDQSDRVHPKLFCFQRVSHRSALVNKSNARRLERGQIFGRVAAGRLYHRDLGSNDRGHQRVIVEATIGRQYCQVYTHGPTGQ